MLEGGHLLHSPAGSSEKGPQGAGGWGRLLWPKTQTCSAASRTLPSKWPLLALLAPESKCWEERFITQALGHGPALSDTSGRERKLQRCRGAVGGRHTKGNCGGDKAWMRGILPSFPEKANRKCAGLVGRKIKCTKSIQNQT